MENLTAKPNQELLSIQGNADEAPRQNSTLVERQQVENSPFWIIGEKNKWFLVMGEHRISPLFESKEEVLQYADEHTYEVLFHMAAIIAEKMVKEELRKHFNNQ